MGYEGDVVRVKNNQRELEGGKRKESPPTRVRIEQNDAGDHD